MHRLLRRSERKELGREFWILDLLHVLVADFRQPMFEWFGLRRGDRLYEAKDTLGISTFGSTHLVVMSR